MNHILCVIIIFLFILLLTIYIFRESSGFVVTKYVFHNSKLKCDEYNIVLLSDLHDRVIGKDNSQLIEAIDKINPDSVFFAGDMITTGTKKSFDFSSTIAFISEISRKYPIYYGIGNHEEKLRRCPHEFPGKWEEFTDELSSLGIEMITDKKLSIDEAGISVYGLDLEHKYYQKFKTSYIPDDYLEKKFGSVDEKNLSILIAHFPDQFTQYAKWKPDLIFSGHIHGGIIALPFVGGVVSPQLKLFPKYDGGLFFDDTTTMVLSRGIGTHTINIRINNKAELIHISIKRG